MFSNTYPCPLDVNDAPLYPGDVVENKDGESVRIVAISSPVTVLITADGGQLEEVPGVELTRTQRCIGDVVAAAYELGRKSKKKHRDYDLSVLAEEYKRDLLEHVALHTARQEQANSEMLRVMNETSQELAEIKDSIEE